jgi:hypothetical protein
MYRALSWFIDCPRESSIDWNSDNAWAAGEDIISVEVNTTVPRAVYLSRKISGRKHIYLPHAQTAIYDSDVKLFLKQGISHQLVHGQTHLFDLNVIIQQLTCHKPKNLYQVDPAPNQFGPKSFRPYYKLANLNVKQKVCSEW